MTAILCFGASGTYGTGGLRGGWPEYLKEILHSKLYGSERRSVGDEVYNLGVPGAGVSETLERFRPELLGRKRALQPDVLSIISIGLNDSRAEVSADRFVSTPESYRSRVAELFSQARELSERTLALGFFPVDEARTAPWVYRVLGRQVYFTNERAASFESAMMAEASAQGVEVMPLHGSALKMDYRAMLSSDGLHPDDEGYRWIAAKVFEALQQGRVE